MNRRTLSRLALLLSSAFVLISVELLFRIYLFGWDAFSVTKTDSVHEIGVAGIVQASPYPEIIYELKPNLRTYFKLVRFETNSEGLRDVEYPLEKPKNTVRVAVVGDSLTMPAGVALEDAYHSVLERMFDANGNGNSYEFVNFGVGGYGLRQYLAVIEHKALAYSPDLILIGYCAVNDQEITPEEDYHRPYRPLATTHPFFRPFSLQTIYRYFQRPLERPFGDAEKRYLREMLERIAQVGKASKVPVVVAYLSNRPEDDSRVRPVVEQSGMYYVDVTAAFRGTDLSEMIIYPIDGHPNAAANRLFAQRIYDFLRAKALL